jgi:probable F420-dependent oxidoreductase
MAGRRIAIGLGLMEFPFADAAGFWRWVDLCEQGGVDSLWQTDRIISNQPILECMATLAALAGHTRRLKFGMNVVSLAMREPVLLAKQCATIDMLSAGRLLPGFGIGSPLAPEWGAMGLEPKERGRRTDEALEIIARLWRGESVDFAGRHNRLTGARIAPLPVQPDLPMWIGGASDAAVRRTARYGTGWQGGPETPAEAGAVVQAIRAALAETGRSIDEDHYGAAFAFRFGAADDPDIARLRAAYERRSGKPAADRFVTGDAAAILRRIGEYVDAGVSKFILRPAVSDGEGMLQQTRLLIERVLPEVATRWPKTGFA